MGFTDVVLFNRLDFCPQKTLILLCFQWLFLSVLEEFLVFVLVIPGDILWRLKRHKLLEIYGRRSQYLLYLLCVVLSCIKQLDSIPGKLITCTNASSKGFDCGNGAQRKPSGRLVWIGCVYGPKGSTKLFVVYWFYLGEQIVPVVLLFSKIGLMITLLLYFVILEYVAGSEKEILLRLICLYPMVLYFPEFASLGYIEMNRLSEKTPVHRQIYQYNNHCTSKTEPNVLVQKKNKQGRN